MNSDIQLKLANRFITYRHLKGRWSLSLDFMVQYLVKRTVLTLS
jgi:hypothetical protein